VLREMRPTQILVAVGACAINGGLPAMRNSLAIGDVLHKVYGDPSARDGRAQMTRTAAAARQGLSD